MTILSRSAIEQLARGESTDPHALLGSHDAAGETIVRAWRPRAASVELLVDGQVVAKLEPIHKAGLFETRLDEPPGPYRFQISYPAGESVVVDDPYRFPSTLGELDLHLIGEGQHDRLHHVMGARPLTTQGVAGVSFAVWAPNARSVGVAGDFNGWEALTHPMRTLGGSGVWELFIPAVDEGARYKFVILNAQGKTVQKADPYARWTEVPPATASRVWVGGFSFTDDDWMDRRSSADPTATPMSIYEVHLGSWRRAKNGEVLTYDQIAPLLADYCRELGFTHVELLPVAEHPFGGSWGYQVGNYFAPTARHGTPDDFRAFVDTLHSEGIGVIIDWVPAHFPKDEWALGRFDGTALYEHLDPRLGEHPDWGTLVFNYGRNEVRNFLISNALYWIEEFHVDGLRVDAVASMLYLDYSRADGEWVPNRFGGNENLEAVEFIRELNTKVHAAHPGVLMIAEESTAWAGVSRPAYLGGLGFGFKWNMGWMHDTLSYFSKDAIYRKFHHNNLTFSLMYAYTENFVLPLSHDEVVHGKGSLLNKMPGDRWQQLANLRALLAYMWAHPGKQMIFMGAEIAQENEWDHDSSLDWGLLDDEGHRGVQRLVTDLNRTYARLPALWEIDFEAEGFHWIDANDAENNVVSFFRTGKDGHHHLVFVANLSPVPRHNFKLGLPREGEYTEVLNTDSRAYGGSDVGNLGVVTAVVEPGHGLPCSARVTLPPLGVIWLYV